MITYSIEEDVYALSRLNLVLQTLHGNLSGAALCEPEAAQIWGVLYAADGILERLVQHFVDGENVYDNGGNGNGKQSDHREGPCKDKRDAVPAESRGQGAAAGMG